MYPCIVLLTHSIELYEQMMRINRKSGGTIAMWFVNLSNQWKSRNRKWLWCLCFAFPKGYSTLCNSTISLEHNYSIQAGAGWFPDSITSSLSCLISKGCTSSSEIYIITLLHQPPTLDWQVLSMQVMTSYLTKLLCPSLSLTRRE